MYFIECLSFVSLMGRVCLRWARKRMGELFSEYGCLEFCFRVIQAPRIHCRTLWMSETPLVCESMLTLCVSVCVCVCVCVCLCGVWQLSTGIWGLRVPHYYTQWLFVPYISLHGAQRSLENATDGHRPQTRRGRPPAEAGSHTESQRVWMSGQSGWGGV